MMLLKLLFILLLDVLWLGLVLSPMNVSAWGCPKMIFRPHPHGHRHPLCSSVTFTLSFLPTMGCAPSQSQARVGARGGRSSQDGASQQHQADPLFLPQPDRLNEAFLVRGKSIQSQYTL